MYYPQQITGMQSYFPTQTIDFTALMNMMLPLIFMAMMAGMVGGL